MYSYDDIKTMDKELKKFILYFSLAVLFFVFFVAAICSNWGTEIDPLRLPVWPAYVVGIIVAVGSVFAWSLIGSRLIKYRRFVYDLLTGMDRIVEGEIVTVHEEISNDNDLEFFSVEVKEDENRENRLLYVDVLKAFTMFKEGRYVKLKVSGNYIKDVISWKDCVESA